LVRFTGLFAGLLVFASGFVAHAAALPRASQVGETYEITLVKDSAQQHGDGSTGSSHDKDTIIERVIGLRADGLELEYDLPEAATTDERARYWQFPARVFQPDGGPATLLNGPELEARVDAWLKAGGWSRAACGHWIFTWTAFQIQCDPQSVVRTIRTFDLRSADVREGASYREAEARSSAQLTRKTAGPDGSTFTVEMSVDPDAIRHARAESDVVLGELINKPVSLNAALRERAGEKISGTILVTFETDPAGNLRRRIKVTRLNITRADDRAGTETVTETLSRRLISGPP
jgi:hypothetical protein